jgi:hypothetical protein
MSSKRRSALVAVPVAALALFATACGDDDGGVGPFGDKGGKSAAAPATEAQLRAAMLTDQEIPADYTGGSVDIDDDEENEQPSDPRCAPLLTNPPRVAGIEREFTPAQGSAEEADLGVTVGLTSYQADVLDKQWDAFKKALNECKTFTLVQGTNTITYTLSKQQTGTYGKQSASLRIAIKSGNQTAQADMIWARVGDVMVRVQATTSDSAVEPRLPAAFVTGQIDKVKSEIGG